MTRMKLKHFAIQSLLAALCASQLGCIGLSREHAVQQWGIHARLVDDASSKPISRRDVVVAVDGKQSKQRTDRNGNLRTLSETTPFWTWLGGPMMPGNPGANITISMGDYRPYSVKWSRHSSHNPQNIQRIHPSLGRPYLELGTIQLHKGTKTDATSPMPGRLP